jgi:hypothetical protein
MLICLSCKETKSEEDFNFRNRKSGIRHQSRCRTCQSTYAVAHYQGNKDAYARKRDRFRARSRETMDALKDVPCADCGGVFPPYVMDFDHCRGEKKFDISRAPEKAWSDVLDEIAKCDVVCANCHRIRTHGAVAKWERRSLQNCR